MTEQKKCFVQGPVGKLETIIEQPFTSNKKLLGIVCHPHPLHQGSMNNKVVTTVIKVFQRLDIVPIRFNFRGVGESEGEHDYSIGEQEDLKAIISWAEQQYKDYKLVLAGFSFGSYIATKVATEVIPEALITIAPAVHHNDFQHLPPINFPWIVVQGESDEVVPSEEVFSWINSLSSKPILLRFPQVGHFFHGELINLRDQLVAALERLIPRGLIT